MTHNIKTTAENNKRLLIELADNLKEEEKKDVERLRRIFRWLVFYSLAFFIGLMTYILLLSFIDKEEFELNVKAYNQEEGRSYGKHEEAAKKYKMDYDPDYYMNK